MSQETPRPRTILITGANRGIGFAIVQTLAQKLPSTDRLILACRSRSAGEEAIQKLREMMVDSQAAPMPHPHLEVIEMDVSSDASIRAVRKTVEERFGRLDVLINNAAISMIEHDTDTDPSSTSTVTVTRTHLVQTFNVNVASVAIVMDAFIPLLLRRSSPSSTSSTTDKEFEPRIINISSSVGVMTDALATPGTFTAPSRMGYSVSKAALNRLTVDYMKLYGHKQQHHQDQDQDQDDLEGIDTAMDGISFYCACPGHCKTGLNGFRGAKDPIDGARVVEELVLAERGRYGFGFWRFVEEEGGMRVREW